MCVGRESEPCGWYGVSCSAAGAVTGVALEDLPTLKLQLGARIEELRMLTALHVTGTRLSGTIPPALGSLTRLQYLDLYGNAAVQMRGY